jgi:transposase-like protein
MQRAITQEHAHPNTVLLCLFTFYEHVLPRNDIARVLTKSETTIGNWIRVYESTGTFVRSQTEGTRKYTDDHKNGFASFTQSTL